MNRRFVLLGPLFGVAAAYGSFAVLHNRYFTPTSFDLLNDPRLAWTAALVAIVAGALYALGLPEEVGSRASVVLRSIAAATLGLSAVSMLQLASGTALLPRSVVIGGSLTLIPWQVLVWNLIGDRLRAGNHDRVLLVSTSQSAAEAIEALTTSAEAWATVVAAIQPESLVAHDHQRHLEHLVDRHQATLVVLDREAQALPSVVSQAAELHAGGLRVRTLSMFSEEFLGKEPLAELQQMSLLFDVRSIHGRLYPRAKRAIDLVFCLLAFPALAATCCLVLVGNLFANRGTLFFRQTRVGRNGEVFEMIKFRTMSASEEAVWTAEDDDRITPLGGVLRRSHLDELPQVINIIRGELSLIGPRPEQPAYVEDLIEKIPFYAVRHMIRPGLTGWAQIKLGYTSDLAGALEKLQYELFYLRRQSFALDARIAARTVRHVLRSGGR